MNSIAHDNVVQFPQGNPAATKQSESNKRFGEVLQSQDADNRSAATDVEAFDEVLHSLPIKCVEQHQIQIEQDIKHLLMKDLKAKYKAEWNAFSGMFYDRCGGKGYICHPAINTFPKFIQVFGLVPRGGWTIDRIDPNNVEYTPTGCEWVSKQRQAENRRNVKKWTHSDGRSYIIPEWSRRTGIPYKTLYRRLNELGWTVDDAVDIPVHGKRKKTPEPPTSDVNVKSAGSEPTAGMSLDEFDRLMERKASIDNLYGKPAEVLKHWETVLREQYDLSFFRLEPKHKAIFWQCFDYWEPDLDAVKVFTHIFENWGGRACGFVAYACERGGFNAPTYPTLTFIKLNILSAGNFYADSVKATKRAEHRAAELESDEFWANGRKLLDRINKRRKVEKKCQKPVDSAFQPISSEELVSIGMELDGQ